MDHQAELPQLGLCLAFRASGPSVLVVGVGVEIIFGCLHGDGFGGDFFFDAIRWLVLASMEKGKVATASAISNLTSIGKITPIRKFITPTT
jgi:hypothetical protein